MLLTFIRRYRSIGTYVGAIAILLLCGLATADVTAPQDPNSTVSMFTSFTQTVNTVVMPAIMTSDGWAFSETLWIVFFVILMVEYVWKYMTNRFNLLDCFEMLFFVAMVRLIMLNYNPITEALWGWGQGFGDSVQTSIVGSPDYFFCQAFIYKVIQSIHWLDLNIWAALAEILCVIILYMCTWPLVIIAYLAGAWTIWCFCVAKLVGWMFVPMLMFKRLEFLFDGWFKFLFGTMLFGVLVRVNLSLECLALQMWFSLPTFASAVPAEHLIVNGPGDVVGLVLVLVMGIFGVVSAGRMAQQIAGAGMSFGSGLRSVANTAKMAAGAVK